MFDRAAKYFDVELRVQFDPQLGIANIVGWFDCETGFDRLTLDFDFERIGWKSKCVRQVVLSASELILGPGPKRIHADLRERVRLGNSQPKTLGGSQAQHAGVAAAILDIQTAQREFARFNIRQIQRPTQIDAAGQSLVEVDRDDAPLLIER